MSVLIIGSGFAGLCMGMKLKEAGVDAFTILERADGIGGTWRDNDYPGCACDVPSPLYSYSFEANPGWSRLFAEQREIRAYLERCAEKHGLVPHIRLRENVVRADFDEARGLWIVRTSSGAVYRAEILVSAMGALSNPAIPQIPGAERFRGRTFHSATWDHGYDLAGKRVAVIGTGASAIQFVPQIAPKVERLDLYQRTPPWILSKPDRPISSFERKMFELFPFTQRLLRSAIYWRLEGRVLGLVLHPKLMDFVKREAERHIARQVPDPELRRKVTPNYTIGCKRILLSDEWYPALCRPNVDVVTEGIREIRENSIVTADGREREVDAIIYGTGFDVQSVIPKGFLFGRNGRDVWDVWNGTPEAYKGTTIAGLPNFFILTGPNTGLGHSSMVFIIESQVAYVMDALRQMEEHGWRALEVKPEVQADYNARLQGKLTGAVWQTGCRSWYLNDAGKNVTIWPDFTYRFRRETAAFDASAYLVEAPAARETPDRRTDHPRTAGEVTREAS